jgi:hypothetical protein
MNFSDVSAFINSTSTVKIGLTLITQTRNQSNNNAITTTSTTTNLATCPGTYFDGFKDSNTDYNYISGLTRAYCLPSNLSITLSAFSSMQSKYARIQIYDTVSNTSTNLQNLLSNYTVGVLMTVPVIDLQNQSFGYLVTQIRGSVSPTTKLFQYNLTLSKQEMTYSTANYSIGSNQKTLSNYNYLSSTNSYLNYTDTTSSLRTYSILLSYNGLVDSYTLRQQHFAEVFGIVGALIALFYFLAAIVGEHFNTFKMRYLVAKKIYLIYKVEASSRKSRKNKKALLLLRQME